jgi:hypothetical protein
MESEAIPSDSVRLLPTDKFRVVFDVDALN